MIQTTINYGPETMTNIRCFDVIELMNQAKIEGWSGHVTGS